MSGLSTRDRALAVGAMIAVAVLVGVAAHPSAEGGAGPAPVAPVVVLLETLLWLVIAADVLVTAAIVYALWSGREKLAVGGRKRSPLVYLAVLVPTAVAALLITFVPPGAVLRVPTLSALLGAIRGQRPGGSRIAAAASGGDVTWISLLLAVLIVTAVVGWFFWGGSKRPNTSERPSPAPHVAVASVLEQSMDALRAITDPRRAIIAAYSAMEHAMERAGLARRRAEAPMEFLARVLQSALDVSLDAKRLTYLFELAKFSDHGIDEAMRTEALQALARIRDQVMAAAAT